MNRKRRRVTVRTIAHRCADCVLVNPHTHQLGLTTPRTNGRIDRAKRRESFVPPIERKRSLLLSCEMLAWAAGLPAIDVCRRELSESNILAIIDCMPKRRTISHGYVV